MEVLTLQSLVGAWISIFLTICVLSFLYDDNPVYKFTEHLFLGVSVGISITEIYYGSFKPNLSDKLMPGTDAPSLTATMFLVMAGAVLVVSVLNVRPKSEGTEGLRAFYAEHVGKLRMGLAAVVGLAVLAVLGQLAVDWAVSAATEPWSFQRSLSLFPLVLVVMLFMKLSKKHGWVARIPIAFIVAAYAGVKLTGEANANLMVQVADSMPSLMNSYDLHGWWSWDKDGAGVISDIVLVVGLVSCLVYFYFSAPAKGAVAWVSRFGILVLMLSFGASFGFTVMGRISLAIGRAQEMLGLDRAPEEVALIHPRVVSLISLGVVVALLAAWRHRGGGEPEVSPPSG